MYRLSEKKTIKKIISPLSESLLNSLQRKSFIPKSLLQSFNNEEEEEEKIALLSDFSKNDDVDNYSHLHFSNIKSSPTSDNQNNTCLNIQPPIDMTSSYYQQQLQHSYMTRHINFINTHSNTGPNTSTDLFENTSTNKSKEVFIDKPSTSTSITHPETTHSSSILNSSENKRNSSSPSLTSPFSRIGGANEETNILDEPLVYPFPDSYYALLLAASNSSNEHDVVKDGNLIQPEVNDFTPWVDQAPLMISVNSSMELATEMFVRLGTRYLCVVLDGHFVGVIHKKALIKYIKSLK